MPDLLLELFSEEIPARMQARAAADLRKHVTDALVERGVAYEGASAYATPRRLALTVHGLPARQPDSREEKRGPRVDAPEAALAGFLKSAGLASIDQAKVETDPKKGSFYVAVIQRPGRPVPDLVAEIVPAVIRAFPWPKSMRWGSGPLRWVRPLHSILCTFGPETEDPEVVRFEVDGIASGDVTRGHRFMADGAFRVRRFEDYVQKLEAARVVLDPARRREIILADARNLVFAQGLSLIEDEAVLDEAAGLVEWPVVLVGAFDAAFLEVPAEAIQATIRANQKCFVTRDGAGKLANRFVMIANIEAKDGGNAIIAGNERVIRARLSDARFFWETDQKPLPGFEGRGKPLDQRLAKLRDLDVVFHEKIGTQGERIDRIRELAGSLAPLVGADPDLARRAAELAKADLMTEMVGEFPELQGLMGRYYATAQGEDARIAAAIEDHYRPKGAGDRVPTEPVAIAVALADKLDTLVSFWAIDEKPTGSKDPYALRRAALGVIRIVLENGLRVSLFRPLELWLLRNLFVRDDVRAAEGEHVYDATLHLGATRLAGSFSKRAQRFEETELGRLAEEFRQDHFDRIAIDLLAFFADRLKVQLREQGARHDLVDAVLAPRYSTVIPGETPKAAREGDPALQAGHPGSPSLASLAGDDGRRVGAGDDKRRVNAGDDGRGAGTGDDDSAMQDDLLLVVRRVEALGAFLDTESGRALLAGFRRAANILRAEEKKDGPGAYAGGADPLLLAEPEEKALHDALAAMTPAVDAAIAAEDFAAAMQAMAGLRAPVDTFFEAILVNAQDPALRLNRLKLLAQFREATRRVAEFSKVEG